MPLCLCLCLVFLDAAGTWRVSQLHFTGYLAAIAAKHPALGSAPPNKKDGHSPLCFQIPRPRWGFLPSLSIASQAPGPSLPPGSSSFPGPSPPLLSQAGFFCLLVYLEAGQPSFAPILLSLFLLRFEVQKPGI